MWGSIEIRINSPKFFDGIAMYAPEAKHLQKNLKNTPGVFPPVYKKYNKFSVRRW